MKTYTYTIITTDANKQMKFIHDRMPVVLEPGSEAVWTWLDPNRKQWTRELQSLLKPFQGELDIYPVSKDVGKISNDSASFIIPVDSKANKSNIANFFSSPSKLGGKDSQGGEDPKTSANVQAEASDFSVGSTSLSVKRKRDSAIDDIKQPTNKRSKLGGPSPRKTSAINHQKDIAKSGISRTPKITSFFKK
jgi:hypothetical protein